MLEVMFRPFRAYEELAARARAADGEAGEHDGPSVVGGAARLLVVVGAFVAWTATGRLTPAEAVGGAISFFYVPLVQLVAFAVAVRVVAPRARLRLAAAMYLAGNGPWIVFLGAIAALCLLASAPGRAIFEAAPFLFVGTWVWGVVVTYACFRRGLGVTRGRAAGATLVLHLVANAFVLGYFLVAGQLRPILPW